MLNKPPYPCFGGQKLASVGHFEMSFILFGVVAGAGKEP